MNLLEMEDHHHQHQEYSMMGDLRQLMSAPTSTTFPSSLSPQPIADLFPGHPNLTPPTHHHSQSHYHNNLNINMNMNMNMNMMAFPSAPLHHQLSTPPALHDFPSTINNVTTAASTPPLTTEADTTCAPSSLCFPPDPSNGRWPRQETLTLLQIRSRLHHKFKDANQKGPLWDELSRIMSEEFGYQRSGKKCREKFENLYKYYKKTKEGKAGRQDGKHYRFFRQLEALCGENNSNPSTSTIPEAKYGSSSLNHSDPSQTNHEKTTMFNYKQHHCESTVSLSNNSTELETSSSSEEDHHNNNVNDESVAAKERKRRWKRKIRDFIDSQMKEVMEKQEAWLERVMKTLEEKEKERVLREEEWSRNEAERAEREHKFWAKERAWIEARDSALMEALQKLTGIRVVSSRKELEKPKEEEEEEEEEGGGGGSEIVNESWEECEMSTLVQIRGEIVHESGYSSEEALWEEVATKMASFGYQKTASMCRRKWQNITNPHHLKQAGNNNNNVMKRSENSSTRCFYFHTSPYNQGQGNTSAAYSNISQQHQPHASSPSNSNVGDASHSDNSCFPFFMCEGENLWENYGLNLNKGNRNP